MRAVERLKDQMVYAINLKSEIVDFDLKSGKKKGLMLELLHMTEYRSCHIKPGPYQ
jgi:hypothetical protein